MVSHDMAQIKFNKFSYFVNIDFTLGYLLFKAGSKYHERDFIIRYSVGLFLTYITDHGGFMKMTLSFWHRY